MSCRPYGRGEGGAGELLRLAFPLILSNSFMTLQLFIDRVLLSKADSDAVAASMPAGLLYWMLLTLPQNIAAYAAVFVAQYTGADRPHRVGTAIWQALYFSVPAGLVFLALAQLADPLTQLMGHSPSIQVLEAAYFRCLCFAALPALIVAAIGAFFSGRGDTWTTMLINAVGVAVNVPLTYGLIFGHWGLPEMGIEGAGWATALGTAVSACLALALFFRPRYQREFNTLAGRAFDPDLFRRLMRFGFPNGLQWMLDCLAFNVFLILMGWIGDAELTATSVAIAINLLAVLPMLGIGQAVEIFVGQRLGEDRPAIAERSTWTGFWLAWSYMCAVAFCYAFTPELFLFFFQNEDSAKWPEAAALVPGILRFVAVYSLFDSMSLTFSFALRGAGDTRFVTAVSVALAWPLMVVPTALAWSEGWGVYWAWGFASAYIIALGVTFLLRFCFGPWKSMRVIEAADPTAPTAAEKPQVEAVV